MSSTYCVPPPSPSSANPLCWPQASTLRSKVGAVSPHSPMAHPAMGRSPRSGGLAPQSAPFGWRVHAQASGRLAGVIVVGFLGASGRGDALAFEVARRAAATGARVEMVGAAAPDATGDARLV